MDELARAMEELLERERGAALRADVEELERIQGDKRRLLDRAEREGGFEHATLERLGERAKANVGLIRHLVTLHRALAGLPPGGYSPDGRQRAGLTPAHSWRVV